MKRGKVGRTISSLWVLALGLFALGITLVLGGLVLDSIILAAKGLAFIVPGIPIFFAASRFEVAERRWSPLWGWREAFQFAWAVVAILVGFGALFALKLSLDVGIIWVATGAVVAGIIAKIRAGRRKR